MDGLTQLYNRRYFDESLSKEISRLQRKSAPISLLICDIDYFKKFNDTYGHQAGDSCIQSVADSIRRHCKRVADVAARYGGEEFGIILPYTAADEAVQIAESIRHDIAQKKIPHSTSSVNAFVSISIGVASIIPTDKTKPAKLISLADEALYESKGSGRDRVTLHHE